MSTTHTDPSTCQKRDLPRANEAHQDESLALVARASVVNRTHRVVRERADEMRSRRSRNRSLWAPLAISALLVVILCSAIWSLLDQYELSPTGIPDASSQFFVVLLWFLPVSAAILAVTLLQRARTDRESLR